MSRTGVSATGAGVADMTGHDVRQQAALEHVAILQELDLGCHTLLLLSGGSMELIANREQASDLTHAGLQLDRDETYRLFISLHEQFKQQAHMEEERTTRERGQGSKQCNW